MPDGITIRRFDVLGESPPLDLLGAGLGWDVDDRHERFFRWKHAENPFGTSPAWVAVADGRLVGLRVFMRWEFRYRGAGVRAVQAVDTVTHPSYQRRGIFRSLTRAALAELESDGTDFVYNTPNDQSGPGYQKEGWQTVGRVPVSVLPRSLAVVARLPRARGAAGRWPLETNYGAAAAEVLVDTRAVDELLASSPGGDRLRTSRSAAFLAWRFGHADLGYRAVLAGTSVEEGVAFVRLRRRGSLKEATVSDVLVPGGDRRSVVRLTRRAIAVSGADVATGFGTGGITIPNRGPLLAWRGLRWRQMPPRSEWDLVAGDLELF